MKVKYFQSIVDDYGFEWIPCIPKTKFFCFTKISTRVMGEVRSFIVRKDSDVDKFRKEMNP